MAFSRSFLRHQQAIDHALKSVMDGKEPEGLYEPMAYLLKAGGKRIRPMLVLLSCEAAGGHAEQAFQAALAVELMHTFTLVHDDIMDRDELRRGRPTVHRQWDEATAILAGDGLVTMAYDVLLSMESPNLKRMLRTFTRGLLELCEGQALDKAFESRNDVSPDEYERMIEKKTARLMEVACECGALAAGAADPVVTTLRTYAAHMGKAFQIQDDLLDLFSDTEVSGKPAGSDLVARKKTYLTLHFFTHAEPAMRSRFLRFWGAGPLGTESLNEVRNLMHQSGTAEAARKRVTSLLDRADSALQVLSETGARADLQALTETIRVRNA